MSTHLRTIVERNGVSWESFWEEMFRKLEKGMTAQNFGEVWIFDGRQAFSTFPPDEKHFFFSVQNLEPMFVRQNRSKALCEDCHGKKSKI